MAASQRSTKAELRRAQSEAARLAAACAQRRSRNHRIGLWSAGVVVVAVVAAVVIVLTQSHGQPASAAGRTAHTSPAGLT